MFCMPRKQGVLLPACAPKFTVKRDDLLHRLLLVCPLLLMPRVVCLLCFMMLQQGQHKGNGRVLLSNCGCMHSSRGSITKMFACAASSGIIINFPPFLCQEWSKKATIVPPLPASCLPHCLAFPLFRLSPCWPARSPECDRRRGGSAYLCWEGGQSQGQQQLTVYSRTLNTRAYLYKEPLRDYSWMTQNTHH